MKLFTVKFSEYHFEQFQIQDTQLSISTDFNENEIIEKINNILEQKELKYRTEHPLTYSYKDGILTVTGKAGYYNPNAPAILGWV